MVLRKNYFILQRVKMFVVLSCCFVALSRSVAAELFLLAAIQYFIINHTTAAQQQQQQQQQQQ
jgi:hypothetical protein